MPPRPIALVTGARRGIGRAIALDLADAGFDIALTDMSASEELDNVCRAIRERGAKAAIFISDLARIETHEALLQSVEDAMGALTCLINNAGVSVMSRGDLLDVTAESYDRCLDVNTRGTFFLMQAFARRVRKSVQQAAQIDARDGAPASVSRSIITITSSNAVAASIQRGEYCVSKAGLSMATTLFSVRLAELGVRVYEVQPGFIDTEMTSPSKARYDALMENGLTAIKRWGTPQEVATVVRTLATGCLPYSVGQAIRVDGGLLVQKY